MNSELYDKKYPIPLPIVEKLKAKLMSNDGASGDGIKRAKFLVHNGYATYQMMKRIKNFFDHFDQEKNSLQEFELSGGEDMRNFIEHSLNTDRDGINRSKELNRSTNPDMMRGLKPYNVTEAEEKEVEEKEVEDNGDDEVGLDLNAIVVVLNPEKRFLLLKRSTYPDQWMPNKWSMPGGAIEDGEEPVDGALRELKEETGIVVTKFKESFVIQRDENVEHVFLSLYEGDPFNIKIDKENQGYGWFGYNEIKFLDTVPNLMDYINITIKDYN
jgi:8-oxo-dGTP pyrophosphatase MutT (NUDIX family)